jgi:hypothetical protein
MATNAFPKFMEQKGDSNKHDKCRREAIAVSNIGKYREILLHFCQDEGLAYKERKIKTEKQIQLSLDSLCAAKPEGSFILPTPWSKT